MQQQHRQRGISLMGLLFWGIVLAFLALVGARVAPTVMEYYTIQKAVNRIAASNPPSVPEARAEFNRIKQVEYSIQSIGAEDLQITKEDSRVVIRFAYERELALFGPAYLLLKYQGQSR